MTFTSNKTNICSEFFQNSSKFKVEKTTAVIISNQSKPVVNVHAIWIHDAFLQSSFFFLVHNYHNNYCKIKAINM